MTRPARTPASFRFRERRLTAVLAALLAAGALGPAAAQARGGGDGRGEVRVAGRCDAGIASALRLRSRDGVLRAWFEIDHLRSAAPWRIVLVQDRRVAWRGVGRAPGAGGAVEIQRRLRDLPGADHVTVRAWGPGGATCAAAATLPG